MKKIYGYLLIGVLLYFLPDACRKMTDGFSIARITSQFPEGITWDDASPFDKSELNEALDQPYRYLGSGGQCFAFVSQDNRYVIKFFKTHFIKFGSLALQTLPFFSEETRKRKMEKALFKLHRDFNSYIISSRDLKKETALLYVHLNKTTNLNKKLLITDKLGIAHAIDLDRFEFAVQRRVELAYPYIESLIQKNELAKAKSAIRSLIEISAARCKKGIYDEDAKIERNFGFLDDRAVFIDLGRFVRDSSRQSPAVYEKDLNSLARQMRSWIESHHPELVSYFSEAL